MVKKKVDFNKWKDEGSDDDSDKEGGMPGGFGGGMGMPGMDGGEIRLLRRKFNEHPLKHGNN